MKRILFSVLFVINLGLFAQQHHSFTQFSLNRFALNPAVAGVKSCNTFNFGLRRQWVGFENAPTLNFASFYTRINKTQRAPRRIHGLGFYVAHESEGIMNRTYLKVAYSYHFKIWKNYSTSIGLFAGIHQVNLNNYRLSTASGQVDPAFTNSEGQDYIYPEISPAFYIESSKMFGGVSLFQAFPTKFKKLGTGKTNLEPHLFLMGGYHFRNRNFTYTPSFLLSSVFFHSPTLDINLKVNYKNKISLGLGGKYVNSAYLFFDVKIFPSSTAAARRARPAARHAHADAKGACPRCGACGHGGERGRARARDAERRGAQRHRAARRRVGRCARARPLRRAASEARCVSARRIGSRRSRV